LSPVGLIQRYCIIGSDEVYDFSFIKIHDMMEIIVIPDHTTIALLMLKQEKVYKHFYQRWQDYFPSKRWDFKFFMGPVRQGSLMVKYIKKRYFLGGALNSNLMPFLRD